MQTNPTINKQAEVICLQEVFIDFLLHKIKKSVGTYIKINWNEVGKISLKDIYYW